MTDRSDSWGWATTMLSMMGRLSEMKKLGHQGFLRALLDEGYAPKLNGMFQYEHQPYLEMLQQDLEEKQQHFDKVYFSPDPC